jgi:hypothetical protein
MNSKTPSRWFVPTNIINTMNCIELTPIVIENNNNFTKEGDQSVNQ